MDGSTFVCMAYEIEQRVGKMMKKDFFLVPVPCSMWSWAVAETEEKLAEARAFVITRLLSILRSVRRECKVRMVKSEHTTVHEEPNMYLPKSKNNLEKKKKDEKNRTIISGMRNRQKKRRNTKS